MTPIGKATHHGSVTGYLVVFGTLMVLTAVTVLVSWLHLPITAAVMVGVAIATFKAALVATFFMHLKSERVLIYGLLGVTLFFMAILFILPISDTAATTDRRIHLSDTLPELHSEHAENVP